MASKPNAFLAKMQAQMEVRANARAQAQVEIDTMALLLAVNDVLHVGPGRAGKVMNSYLAYKLEIAEEIDKELEDCKSKQKDVIVTRKHVAARLKRIMGPETWNQYKQLFPFLWEYWEGPA